MEILPRPARKRRTLLLTLGAIALVPLLYWLLISTLEARNRHRMEQVLRELLREETLRDAGRPTLIGPSEPGNAWDHYTLALEGVKDCDFGYLVVPLGKVGAPDGWAKVEAAVPRYVRSLEELRRGTRCKESKSPDDLWSWSREYDFDSPLAWIQQLAALALCDARILRREGSLGAMVERLLDVCQFGRDVSHNSAPPTCHLGNDILWRALRELMACVESEKLSTEELNRIDHAMTALDATFPRQGDWMLNDLARTGREILSGAMKDRYRNLGKVENLDDAIRRSDWRFGGSRRLAEASAFHRSLGWARAAAEAESTSWHAEGVAWRRIVTEDQAGRGNLALGLMTTRNFLSSSHLRSSRAMARLLRVASRYLSTGEILDLEDPFGSRLGHRSQDGKVRFWSIGESGLEEDGKEKAVLDRWAILLEVGP